MTLIGMTMLAPLIALMLGLFAIAALGVLRWCLR